MKKIHFILAAYFFILQLANNNLAAQGKPKGMNEPYRPQVHFSPAAHWINDPNGMVYNNGIYHLFFQYHPYSSVWGPMHWGHATSADMIHWKEQPIALYPDSIGTIFSGSAVLDKNNTSGFGKNGYAPLVAIFTQHNTKGEKEGRNDFQNQSIAYSNDNGKTWTKYAGNPVLKNPGITDFRDPKVMWYQPQQKWVMTLATKDHISFYSSKDLKQWIKESEFGATIGAHGGVWECPDLIAMNDNGKTVWVLLVNLNPGGPNKGSATQYFIGDFDGKTFTPFNTKIKWVDYGPDEYAGVTWSNTGSRKIFLGWMSNWMYANQVPTEKWRNGMTLPRDLQLRHIDGDIFVTSQLVPEFESIQTKPVVAQNIKVENTTDISERIGKITFPCRIKLDMATKSSFSLVLSNDSGEKLVIGFDKTQQQYFIDRAQSGKTNFANDFAARYMAPRLVNDNTMDIDLMIDNSSVELFADKGLTVMTSIFFPTQPYTQMQLTSPDNCRIVKLTYYRLSSIWKQ